MGLERVVGVLGIVVRGLVSRRAAGLGGGIASAAELAVTRTTAVALGLAARREHGMPDPPLFRPHVTGARYGFTHYNLVFPELPAPHLFMACAVMIGQTGTRTFDDDHAVGEGPRDAATVAVGTAATAPGWFRSYSVKRECELSEDGAVLRFGHEVAITGTYPEFMLSVSREDFTAEIRLSLTDDITWFARSLIYEHVGLPARYEGTICWYGQELRVRGVCSFEYARATPVNVFANRPVPALFKLPMDFFTYQVMAIDADTLLLLTHVRAMGRPLMTTAHITGVGEDRTYSRRDIRFDRGEGGSMKVAPDGARTRVPERFWWTAGAGRETELTVETVLDTEMIYGIGRGWIGGLRFTGRYDGKPIEGRGYVEYIDRPFRGRDS